MFRITRSPNPTLRCSSPQLQASWPRFGLGSNRRQGRSPNQRSPYADRSARARSLPGLRQAPEDAQATPSGPARADACRVPRTLRLKGTGSEHSYSLRPSEARALEQAEVVFWVGETMETFLIKPLKALAPDAEVIELWRDAGPHAPADTRRRHVGSARARR